MTTVNWLNIKYTGEEIDALKKALKYGDISGFSPVVEEFESICSEFTGSKYALACCNGTAALIVSFMALERYYDKKLTIAVPTWTYIAPVNAADLVGNLVLVDSDLKSHNMSSELPDGIDVICPVDMAGVPADYQEFKKYNLPIISDAAESFGSTYNGQLVGTLADITTTSFQSAKIINTGEGGMIFTDNKDLAKICKDIINQGYGPKGYAEHSHIAKGYNFRLSALQAAIGCVQMTKLEENLEKRRKVAEIYDQINSNHIEKHQIPGNCKTNNYSYLIMLPSKKVRDALKSYLHSQDITTKLFSPVHKHQPYENFKGLPNADYIYDHHLRLPIHNEMTEDMATYVAEKIYTGLRSSL
jgi:dTDP-4-amino-4,6-dideoxygalactose transaminase